MHEHIEESGECTLVIDTVMGVETLILGVNESVTNVLRYSVDSDRDTLNIGLDLIQYHKFLVAAGILMDTIEVGIAS